MFIISGKTLHDNFHYFIRSVVQFCYEVLQISKKTNKQTNTLTVHGQFEDINKIILLLCNA